MAAGLTPSKENESDLAQVIEKILDNGLVLNADIAVSIAGTELLGIKIRATLASFETAAKYGLEFPSGTNYNAPGWREIEVKKASCPSCGNERSEEELLEKGCPICGWTAPLKLKPLLISRTH